MRLILFLFSLTFTFFTSLSVFTLITDNLFIGAFQLVISSLIGAIAWFLVHLFKQLESHADKISDIQLKVALLENSFTYINKYSQSLAFFGDKINPSHSKSSSSPNDDSARSTGKGSIDHSSSKNPTDSKIPSDNNQENSNERD